jgi:hypothetical protein
VDGRLRMHCDVEESYLDLWRYHDAGDCRQVRNVLSFSNYALSPSTERMILFQSPENPMLGEVRVYGPEGQFVWFEVNKGCSPFAAKMLTGLFLEFKKCDKLQAA